MRVSGYPPSLCGLVKRDGAPHYCLVWVKTQSPSSHSVTPPQLGETGLHRTAPHGAPQGEGLPHYCCWVFKVPTPHWTSSDNTPVLEDTPRGLERVEVWTLLSGFAGIAESGATIFLWYLAKVEQLLSKNFLPC